MKALRTFIEQHHILLIVAAVLILAYLMYPRPRQESRDAGVTEIVFWTPSGVGPTLRTIVEEFERRNPQYQVLMGTATVKDSTGDPTRFLLGVAGQVPPDLIYFDRFAVVEWASRGAFTDLTPYLERDRDRPDGVNNRTIYAPAWNEACYKGRMYAIPNAVDTRALYYHRDSLIRAGLVYAADDPAVRAGKAVAGDARPPRTWEELCRKRVHAVGSVDEANLVTVSHWLRRPGVNTDLPEDTPIDLGKAGVRAGDVVALVAGENVWRGRIGHLRGAVAFTIDFDRDQRPGTTSVPREFRDGDIEVKIFDQDSYVPKLTRFDPRSGELTAVGFIPLFGNSWLYMYGWLNGAHFMNAEGNACTLDSPEVVEALQYITDVYDALGGRRQADAFSTAAASGALDPFLTGHIAMRIDGDWFTQTITAFKPELRFGVVGAPIPEKRLRQGFKPVGWMGGWSYAIPSTAKRKDAAWDLLRWLCSEEANRLRTEADVSMVRARGQRFLPRLHPDRRIMAWLQKTYIDDNPSISADMKKAFVVFKDLLPGSKYRPVTPVGQKLWNEHMRATDAATNHTKNPYDALSYGTRQVQLALDHFLHPPQGPLVPWKRLVSLYVLGVALFFLGLIVWQEWRLRRQGRVFRAWLPGYICASPWIFGFVVFGLGPIVFSLIISFCHYDVLNPARFIGLRNYINLLGTHWDAVLNRRVANDPMLWKSLENTGFMIIGVPIGIIAGLALAMLLNSKVRGLHVFRTIYYLPAVVPAVASFILWIWIFDPVRGLLNQVLRFFGVMQPPHWLQDPVWAKPALIIMGLWGVGSGMIIWLAGLREIPESLYEASRIDGANRLQQFRHITLPLLTPYIFFNLIMGMIGVFQVFQAAYIMTNGGPADSTLFYAYKLFNEAFRYLNMGTASAMAWILFLVVLAVTLVQLWSSRKWVHYER